MEHIRKAVERAGARPEQQGRTGIDHPRLRSATAHADVDGMGIRETALNRVHLESNRIISHDGTDPRSRSFDMLRTQVLQAMDQKGYQMVAVTSPTTGCGKTLTAINLALSIARQPERSVLLVDMDLQKPQVASRLGIECKEGLFSVLEGRTSLPNAIIQARIGAHRFMVLPAETSTPNSSEWMASSLMRATLQNIKRDDKSRIVILDMPPILSSDDVIAILPQIDCVLLVTAVGVSTVPEIEESNRHLQSADIVRIVLNKVPEQSTNYYY